MAANRLRPRRRYHHGDLPGALIAEARRTLEKAGPESISFRAIARAAGVSQTAPYNHFASKEHLLATLAASGFRELERSQEAAIESSQTIKEQIEALGRAYVRFALSHPQLYRLMFGVGMSHWRARPEVDGAKKASFEPLKKALVAYLKAVGRNNDDGAVETAAVAAWAMVHGLSMLLIDGVLDVPRGAGDHPEMLTARVAAWLAAGLESGVVSLAGPPIMAKPAPIRARRRRK